MKIYTTYFNNLINLPDTIIPISICGKPPHYWIGREYKKLAPKYDFFKVWKQTHDNDYYVEQFNKQVLNNLDPAQVVNELFQMVPSDCTVALVCYEKPNQFCHRHLVADWLRSAGYEVSEYMGSNKSLLFTSRL